MRQLAGLREIADGFDGYVVDLWGVMHDGVRPYPGAVHALAMLREREARVVLLSNAPRRAAAVEAGLAQLGVGRALYDSVVTSGEATHAALGARPDAWFEALGRCVYHLGPPRDRSVFEGLRLMEASRPGEASFVLNTGPDDLRGPADPALFDDVLEACRAAGLPMLCANPDLTVVRDGVQIACAGALAARYASMGGDVRQVGKPDPAIYRTVMEALGTAAGRTLAVGDSLRTDIAGARNAGIGALWISGGIHDGEVGAEVEARSLGAAAVMRRFEW